MFCVDHSFSRSIQVDVQKLFVLLNENQTIVVSEDQSDELSDDEDENAFPVPTNENDDEDGETTTKIKALTPKPIAASKKKHKASAKKATDNPNLQYISSSLVSIIERLDDEFNKSLQQTDPHSTEYIERLRDVK